jgi:Bacterial EndoU nuclease
MEKPRLRKKHLLPFFDRIDNPELHHFPREVEVDITPPLPDLSPFDRDLLQVCGNLGDRVNAKDFIALLIAYPQVLKLIKTAVNGEIFPGRTSDTEFIADLTEIWFKRDGFEHIFCGTIDNGQLKGMHYVGRYLQLQELGVAGRLPDNHHQEETISGVVYTLGVLLKHDDRFIIDRRNGYALVTDAAELLVAATVAFKSKSRSRTVINFPVVDADSGHTYSAIFVKEDNAIVTFYPDATPTDSQL